MVKLCLHCGVARAVVKRPRTVRHHCGQNYKDFCCGVWGFVASQAQEGSPFFPFSSLVQTRSFAPLVWSALWLLQGNPVCKDCFFKLFETEIHETITTSVVYPFQSPQKPASSRFFALSSPPHPVMPLEMVCVRCGLPATHNNQPARVPFSRIGIVCS
jgi:hypothetical protein